MAQCLDRRPAEEAPDSLATLAWSLAMGPSQVAVCTHSQAAVVHLAPMLWRKVEATPKREPKVRGAGGNNSRAEGRKGKGFAPELDTGDRNDSSLDRASAGDAHDGCP